MLDDPCVLLLPRAPGALRAEVLIGCGIPTASQSCAGGPGYSNSPHPDHAARRWLHGSTPPSQQSVLCSIVGSMDADG